MTERRLSVGGQMVRDSLAAVGYTAPPAVSLVETAAPRLRAHEVVLAQNAWCVLSGARFRELVEPYPRPIRARHVARRAVAAVNLRRASATVALSHAMGDLMAGRGLAPVVSPVTMPIDYLVERPRTERPSWVSPDRPFMLLPGSVTWYKRSDRVVDLARECREAGVETPLVILAGGDDGSGCLQFVQRSLGDQVLQGVVSRAEMRWLLENAEVTVVPSQLESLSFSLGEALLTSRRVLASRLPVHVEVADRVGRGPRWLPETGPIGIAEVLRWDPLDRAAVPPRPLIDEWHALASTLRQLADAWPA
ncbi:hypothetical protein GCM10023340_20180 [Nocardioides marinquilinus]|uniref:Glycosyltransferase n=1 Tax=Nocardioides marinquilinus TaxID=1210400 RepID=A0ABP9PJA0_9ACTN